MQNHLRIDVHPSNLNADLLPWTHFLEEEWDGVSIEMETPVQLDGALAREIGSKRKPGGEAQPVQAQLEAWVPGSVMGGGDISDALTGAFAFHLPPSDDYTLAVIPGVDSELSFQVLTGQSFLCDQDLSLDLGPGTAVDGLVTDDSGAALAGMRVQAVERGSGVASPEALTDEAGSYSLRLAPGSYDLRIQGAEGDWMPTTTIPLEVQAAQDISFDMQLGPLEPVEIEGWLALESNNMPAAGASVRFVSHELYEHPDAQLELLADTDDQGRYRAQLLPGSYDVELFYGDDTSVTPQRVSADIPLGASSWNVGVMPLQGFANLASCLFDANGLPLAGATVQASEPGFGGRTWSATTDETGSFALFLPSMELDFVLVPTTGPSAVTHLSTHPESFPQALRLEEGQRISGSATHDGQPVPFALLEVRDSYDVLYAITLTDEQGEFEVWVDWDEPETEAAENDAQDTGLGDTGD